MELTFLGIGTRGDLYPLLGIAREAQDRGHGVRVLEYDEYRDDVLDAGLSFVPVGAGSQSGAVFAGVPLGSASADSEWKIDRLGFEAALASASAFVSVMRALDPLPDASVAPGFHIGAALASEILSVPLIAVYLGSSVLEPYDQRNASGFRTTRYSREARLIDRVAMPRINRIRRDVGLPETRDSFARADLAGGVVLAPGPLRRFPPGAPSTFESAGYPRYFGPSTHTVDSETKSFLKECSLPLVICTLGDGWVKALPVPLHELFIDADYGIFRLLFVGSRVPGLTPGRNTRVLRRANLLELMDYADVSVNHGGMGTIMAALSASVPSVTVSQWPDGRRNARLLAEYGLGRDLGAISEPGLLRRAILDTVNDSTQWQLLDEARHEIISDPNPTDIILTRLEAS